MLFFGGGWQNGSPAQFYPQCARFAALGMVAISADDRIASRNHTSPREAVGSPVTLAGLVLFNPVIDNGPGGYGYDRVKDYYQEISPLHNLMAGMPPTLVMFGTKDKFVPGATAEKFKADTIALGNRCDLIFYEGQAHGFFNYKAEGNPYFEQSMTAAEAFLASIGVLPAAKP